MSIVYSIARFLLTCAVIVTGVWLLVTVIGTAVFMWLEWRQYKL